MSAIELLAFLLLFIVGYGVGVLLALGLIRVIERRRH